MPSRCSPSRLDDFVPASHPLRPVLLWLNDALGRVDGFFSRMLCLVLVSNPDLVCKALPET